MLKLIVCCWYLTCCCILFGCKPNQTSQEKPSVRPAKVIVLKKTQPIRSLRLTGSAKAWQEESLAFEINGRVENVLDQDVSVGVYAQQKEDGYLKVEGQVIAELDSSRYDADGASAIAQLEYARAQAKAIEKEIADIIPQDIERAKARVDSLVISLRDILPQELKKARAELDRANRELDRTKRLYEQDTQSQREYDQAKAQYEVAQAVCKIAEANIPFQQRECEGAKADLEKAKAALTITQAQLEAAKAREKMAEAQLTIARRNQQECKLRAPFSGVISSRRVSRGAVVGPSQPVVVITIMDPILIEVAVSAELARTLQAGDPVAVFPTTFEEHNVIGWVQEKSVVADPGTRTYNITCMVRNQLITPRGGSFQKKANYITKEDTAAVWHSDAGIADSPLMVWTESILKDEKGYFSWCIQGFRLGQEKVDFREVIVSKLYFKLGEGFKSFGVRHFREIEHQNQYKEGMLTLRKDLPGLEVGAKVAYVPTDWMIRPGDLVSVCFDCGFYPEGVYIPVEAILSDQEGHYIFLYNRQEKRAAKAQVEVGESFRNTRRVQSKEPLDGKELIVFGTHYIKDRDYVAAFPLELNNP